jgi:hypothetical protein
MHDLAGLTPFERRLSDRLAADLGAAVRPFDPAAIAAGAIAAGAIGRRELRAPRSRLLVLVAIAVAVAAVGTVAGGARLLVTAPPTPSPLSSAAETGAPTPTAPPTPDATAVPPRQPGFVLTGSMADPRAEHFAVALGDGSVLVGAGRGPRPEGAVSPGSATYWNTTERWSPATGTWTASAALGTSGDVVDGQITRVGQQAFALRDGRVLVVPAGCACRPMPTLHAEIWADLGGSASVTTSPTLELALVGHSVTQLADGRFLIAGGIERLFVTPSESLATAEVWDPASGTITETAPMPHDRAGHVATLLADGRVLLVGGVHFRDDSPVREADIWDPGTGSFTTVPSLRGVLDAPKPVDGQAERLITLADGRVLILDGRSARTWDPITDRLDDAGRFLAEREGYAAALLADGRVLIVGGQVGEQLLSAAELWDPATSAFTTAGTMITPRRSPTATVLPDGRVLIVGGFTSLTGPTAAAELWVPRTTP